MPSCYAVIISTARRRYRTPGSLARFNSLEKMLAKIRRSFPVRGDLLAWRPAGS